MFDMFFSSHVPTSASHAKEASASRSVMMQVPVSKHSAFLRPRFRGPWRNRFAGLRDDHFLRILELNEVRSKKCHVIRVVLDWF